MSVEQAGQVLRRLRHVHDAEVGESPAQDHLVVVHHLLVDGDPRHDDRNAADLPGIHHAAGSTLEHDRVSRAVLVEELLVRETSWFCEFLIGRVEPCWNTTVARFRVVHGSSHWTNRSKGW